MWIDSEMRRNEREQLLQESGRLSRAECVEGVWIYRENEGLTGEDSSRM